MKTYKALVIDKQTKKSTIITSDYPTKQAFIQDLRANGYSIYRNQVADAETFDNSYQCEACGKWHTKENKTYTWCAEHA